MIDPQHIPYVMLGSSAAIAWLDAKFEIKAKKRDISEIEYRVWFLESLEGHSDLDHVQRKFKPRA